MSEAPDLKPLVSLFSGREFKIALNGCNHSGAKTSLILRIADGVFYDTIPLSYSIDYWPREVDYDVGGTKVHLKLRGLRSAG